MTCSVVQHGQNTLGPLMKLVHQLQCLCSISLSRQPISGSKLDLLSFLNFPQGGMIVLSNKHNCNSVLSQSWTNIRTKLPSDRQTDKDKDQNVFKSIAHQKCQSAFTSMFLHATQRAELHGGFAFSYCTGSIRFSVIWTNLVASNS